MSNTLSRLLTAAVAVGGLTLASVPSYGAALSGTLNINGAVTVANGVLDFTPAGTGTGTVSITGVGNTGDFAVYNSASGLGTSTATIRDLNSSQQPVDGTGVASPNGDNFLTTTVGTFTLTFISPGVLGSAGCSATPPAAGQVCSPTGTQFNLQNLSSSNSSVNFAVNGTVSSATGGNSTFTGVFVQPSVGRSYQDLLGAISGSSSVTLPFSANFIVTPTAVPEPSTLTLLFGAGLVGAAMIARKRQAAK